MHVNAVNCSLVIHDTLQRKKQYKILQSKLLAKLIESQISCIIKIVNYNVTSKL